MKTKKWFVFGLTLMLITGIALAVPGGTVAAAGLEDETPPPAPAALEGRIKTRLENQFSRLQNMLGKQAERVGKLPDFATKVQTRIDTLTAKGLDTSALENALATFNAAIPGIQSLHDNAAAILSTHSGFGADGMVTDIAAARSTLESARQALGETHDEMKSVAQALLQAMRDFRAANPPPAPASTETPG